MKKVLKILGLVVAGLLAIVVIAVIGLYFAGGSRLTRTYDVTAESITVPSDAVALARGEHLVDVMCRDCHGADLTGQVLVDQPPLFVVTTANITGVADSHSVEELVLAIRHGLDGDGTPLLVMPAESFIYLSEADLGAVIAYLQTLPRIGEAQPAPQLLFVGRVLAGTGAFDNTMPASYIDHDTPFPDMPEVAASEDYGEYLARFCQGCHGAELAGGQPPEPDAPRAPNLTPGGALVGWTEADFINTLRTGMTPGGYEMGEGMPWESFAKLEDQELQALWLYLSSLPARETVTE